MPPREEPDEADCQPRWKGLITTRDAVADAASARALMLAQPSVIKRPVVQWADGVSVGFDAEAWQPLLIASPT